MYFYSADLGNILVARINSKKNSPFIVQIMENFSHFKAQMKGDVNKNTLQDS